MQFPLDRLCLHWLLPISRTEVPLPHKVGEEGLETNPYLPEFLRDDSEEEHCLSDPISLSVPLPTPPPQLEEGTQMGGGSGCHPSSTQMDRGLQYHPSLKPLQDNNQARAQLEYELIQEAHELVESYEHKQAKQAWRHTRSWHSCWTNRCHLSGGDFAGKFNRGCQITALVCHCGHASLLHKWSGGYCHLTG